MFGKLAFISFLPIVLGQNYGGSSPTTTSSTQASSTASSSSSLQTIAVAKDGLTFTPNTLTVQPGTNVVFQFFQTGHSVTEAAFNAPCQPSNSSGINSGFSTSTSGAESFFTVQVNSTDPIWLYCAQIGHCQAGMVAVINPGNGQTIDQFKTAASSAGSSTMPPGVQGGVFGNPPSGTTSGTGASSTPTNMGNRDHSNVGAWMFAGLVSFALASLIA